MNVVISGAGQGIGKGAAKYLLEKGCSVLISDSDAEAGTETVDEYRGLGDIAFIKADNGRETDIKKLVAAAAKRFDSIDGLVNNAGIGAGKPIEKFSLKEWNRVLSVNLTGHGLLYSF